MQLTYRCGHTHNIQLEPYDLHICMYIFTRTHTQYTTYCNLLQHTTTYCNTLQHTATCCNTLQHTATYCNAPRLTVTHCNTLQHTATRCTSLQHTAICCNRQIRYGATCPLYPYIHIIYTFIRKHAQHTTNYYTPHLTATHCNRRICHGATRPPYLAAG